MQGQRADRHAGLEPGDLDAAWTHGGPGGGVDPGGTSHHRVGHLCHVDVLRPSCRGGFHHRDALHHGTRTLDPCGRLHGGGALQIEALGGRHRDGFGDHPGVHDLRGHVLDGGGVGAGAALRQALGGGGRLGGGFGDILAQELHGQDPFRGELGKGCEVEEQCQGPAVQGRRDGGGDPGPALTVPIGALIARIRQTQPGRGTAARGGEPRQAAGTSAAGAAAVQDGRLVHLDSRAPGI